jgi:hypothetical protein
MLFSEFEYLISKFGLKQQPYYTNLIIWINWKIEFDNFQTEYRYRVLWKNGIGIKNYFNIYAINSRNICNKRCCLFLNINLSSYGRRI